MWKKLLSTFHSKKFEDKPNFIVSCLAVIGIIGVLIFLCFGKKLSPFFEPSVFRLTYQFFILALLGGALSFLIKELSREKQAKEEALLRSEDKRRLDNERLREIHSDLLGAFNQTKTVKRNMEARVYLEDDGEERVLMEDYDREMQQLNAAQLVFETYLKRAKYSKLWFEQAEDLKPNLKAIEEYLNTLLNEYQKKRRCFDGDPSSYALSNLENLREFIGPKSKWESFDQKFKTPMRETLISLDEARLS